MDSLIMDDSGDNYDESDAFSPAAKKSKVKPAPKKAAPPKAAPAKAPSKKLVQTTLKTKSAPKKRPKPDSDDESSPGDVDSRADGSDLSNTPPSAKKQKKEEPAPKKHGVKPLQALENESVPVVKPSGSKAKAQTATELYQRLTHLEQIIKRPDTYIGSVERTEDQMWVYNSATEQMESRKVSYVPGLYKIFDEILVNAADNKQNDQSMKSVKVTIDRQKGEICIENDGRGIPVEIHEKEKMYIPEMIFGHLLTGSNYDDEKAKTTGGRNGYGAKLCNIFSTEFTVETQDNKNVKRYRQTWTDNMGKMGKAKITTNKSSDFTRVTFTPDFKRFGMDGMDDDLEALFKRRVYDLAGTLKGVTVHLNGERIKANSFEKYIKMYTKAINKEREGEEAAANKVIIDDTDAHTRWEIGFAVSDGSFQQVSFVNSIATASGGTHVNYIADQICNNLLEFVKKKNSKGAAVKVSQIRNHIFLFVNCLINNPAFTSQTKEQLTTKISQFGSKCVLTDDFLKKIKKGEIVQNILHFAQQKADKELAKSDGNKRSRMSNTKLVDANFAGTRHGHECTLILTEGDSAKGLAVAGRAILDPDRIGVFPLRGKLLNVRDASLDQITKNTEIQNIKQFLGLKHKTVYTDTKGLRYGHLMIMADQDHDGSHIKGLLINFLQVQYPSLLKLPDFFREFITPIVKVWKKKKNPQKLEGVKTFFTMPQYEEWKARHVNDRTWEHKYFKGLGTSTAQDAQVYFTNLDDHLKEFNPMKVEEEELFELAFSKKKADARKQWLGNFVPGTFLDHSTKKITYDDFVNRELILFSMADNLRSIPSVIDGLKPGQRKVLYACFHRNLVKDTKVVELAGYCSELTAYHHGEASLHQTIIALAQNFVGSNNVNCLEPSGNFGTRLEGGSDAASPRYIFTRLTPFARRIFSPLDEPILTYNTDDDRKIEPTIYAPVVPMILLNGAEGIGTGWSTSIPNYHPVDVVNNLKRRMGRLDGHGEEKPFEPMMPWFRGWKGVMEQVGPDRFKFNGIIRRVDGKNEVEVTELPIRVWTSDFKGKLEEIIKAEKVSSFIKDYQEYNDHENVHFIIQLDEKHMNIAVEEGLEERFKLNKTIATSNLVAFDVTGRIRKYEKVEDILEEFYPYRLQKYTERKQHCIKVLGNELQKLSNQARFVSEIIENKLVVSKKPKPRLVDELRKKGYQAFPKVNDAKKAGETSDVVQNTDEVDDDEEGGARDYDYLLGLPIWSLTQERVDKLHKQMVSKKQELEDLKALSEKDLWCQDLDEFIKVWDDRLAEEKDVTKKIRGLGRRASKKIGAGKSGKLQSRLNTDDDYAPRAPKFQKANPAKGVIKVTPEKSSQKFMKMFDQKQKPKPKVDNYGTDGTEEVSGMSDDDFAAVAVVATKTSRAPSEQPAGGRNKRAAAVKPKNWVVDDESDSDDDKLLGDVGDMVKGIGMGATDATTTSGRVSLFAMSRRESSSGARPTSSNGLQKIKGKNKAAELTDNDETNYEMLAKPSPHKSAPAGSAKLDSFLSDDDDDIALPLPVKKAHVVKAAPRPKKVLMPKKPVTSATASSKSMMLSPAAKAYALKQNKMKLNPQIKKTYLSDEEDDDIVMADDDSLPSKPATKRPARAAAVVKAKKPVYIDSDSDEMDVDEGESALVVDDDSDDFDENDY